MLLITLIPSSAWAGLVMSTTPRPSDGPMPFFGVTIASTQAPYATFTLSGADTISAVEIHGGGFSADPIGQFIAKVFTSEGHNPVTDVGDATAIFHLPARQTNNALAILDTPLTGSFFQVFIIAPSPYGGGALSTGHGPTLPGTTTGTFFNNQYVHGNDGTYIAIYSADIRPTPEPSTIIAAALGSIALAFMTTRRNRR